MLFLITASPDLQIEVSWRANLVWFGLVGCLTRLGISEEHRQSLVWFTEVISHRKSWVKNKGKRWEWLSPHYSLRQVPRRRLMFRKKGSQSGPVHLDKGDHLSCGQPTVRPDSELHWRLCNLGLAFNKVIAVFAFTFIKANQKHQTKCYSEYESLLGYCLGLSSYSPLDKNRSATGG